MKKPPRDTRFFEEYCRRNRMKPVIKVFDPDGEILLGDSGEPFLDDGKLVYRTGYAINRDGLDIGNHADYDALEFFGVSRASGQQKRIDEALYHARVTMGQLKESGYYDADRKRHFSSRPDS